MNLPRKHRVLQLVFNLKKIPSLLPVISRPIFWSLLSTQTLCYPVFHHFWSHLFILCANMAEFFFTFSPFSAPSLLFYPHIPTPSQSSFPSLPNSTQLLSFSNRPTFSYFPQITPYLYIHNRDTSIPILFPSFPFLNVFISTLLPPHPSLPCARLINRCLKRGHLITTIYIKRRYCTIYLNNSTHRVYGKVNIECSFQ